MAYYSLKARFFVASDGSVTERVRTDNIPNALRREVWETHRKRCAKCYAPLTRGRPQWDWRSRRRQGHIDHILPTSRGGQHERANLRLLCDRCNLSRKALD